MNWTSEELRWLEHVRRMIEIAKQTGIWDKLESYYLFNAPTKELADIDWKKREEITHKPLTPEEAKRYYDIMIKNLPMLKNLK
jgi:hypothetical protein